MFNRQGTNFEHTQKLIQLLKERTNCRIRLFDITDSAALRREVSESALLTNATSVGMAPNTDASLIQDATLFRPDLIVSDVIYHPSETKLLRDAKKAGCRTQNGLSMLLYQGAESFRLWTGEEMPVSIIREKYFC